MTPDQTTASGRSSSGSSTVREELSADASRLGDSAKDRAREEAESRKQQVTQTARSASSALGRAADDLDQDAGVPSWLSSAFRQTANGIERLAGSIEGRSADELGRNLTSFARQNPTAFLAASAAAGFAAARFLRAGAEYKQEHSQDAQGGADSTAGSAYGGMSGPGGTSVGSGVGQGSADAYGTSSATGSASTASGYASTSGSSTGSDRTEIAGYGSNPVQGGAA